MGDNALSGLLPGGSSSVLLFSTPQYDERWAEAELITADLIGRIQPSWISEERRKAVIEYVEQLIQKHFGFQVCTFGSVPLKTYLPDGDIDLTAFSWLHQLNDTWANDLRSILESEEHSKNAKFRVKEVQCIRAEVEIVKCLVDNIIVDISFNQLGGLCTLCFLEEVDQSIGKDHLFKRSIILIKAWCFYESRILGAHHGLISTYALETLVLYIFHVFHDSLHGPLEVLFRFMEFFSKFDWEHYCLSLWGPIHLSALHEMAAEPPQKHGGRLLLSHAFLYACSQAYAVLPVGQDNRGRMFSSKHMNVVDPLRINNNLGRSVSRGNFYRIRSAFAYGARKLEKILRGPTEEIAKKLDDFFCNTKKHCTGHQPDAPDSGLDCPKVVPTDPCKDEEENQMSEVDVERSKVAAPTKNYNNIGIQASVAVANSNTKKQIQETLGHSIHSSEAIVHALSHTASNGDTLETEGLGIVAKVRKGACCRGRNPSSAATATASKSQLKGTDSINVTGVPKEKLSLDNASVPIANVEFNNRTDIENAKDLASFQDRVCPRVSKNYLQNQISINDSNTVSCESWVSSTLGSLPSSKETLRSQAIDQVQGCSNGLHSGMECARKENLGSGHDHPLPMCCCQHRESDVGNHHRADHLLVPSTVETSKMVIGSSLFFSEAGNVKSAPSQCISSVANQISSLAHSTNLQLPAASNLTIGTTSYVLEDQNRLVYEECHEKSCQSCFRSTSLSETWCGSTNTSPYGKDAGAPLASPGFSSILGRYVSDTSSHVACASSRNKTVRSLGNLEDCSNMIPLEAGEGKKNQIPHGKNKVRKDTASSSFKKYHDHYYPHDSVKCAIDAHGDRASGENESRIEATPAFGVNEVKGPKAGKCSEELVKEIVKDGFYQDQMSKSDFDSICFKDAKWTKTGFVMDDTGNPTTRDDKDLTRTLVSESLAVNENQGMVGALGVSSPSAMSAIKQEEIAVANGILGPLTEESTVDVHSSDRLNGKAVMNPGSFTLRDNLENSSHEISNDKPVVLGVGETLKASGIPVTSGLRVHTEDAAAVVKGARPGDLHADILRGDFPTYLYNLQVGRVFQNSQLYGPLFFTSALGYPCRQMQEQYAWEGPGRPTTRSINMLKPLFTYRHGRFPDPALSVVNPHNVPNNIFREELPKFHRGTGTYLPNLMSGSCRDRQLIGCGRGSRGTKFPDRGGRLSQDGTNSFLSRYHGMSRGQARHEGRSHSGKLNLHVEKKNTEKKLVEKAWEMSQEESKLLRSLSGSPVNSSANVRNTCDSTVQEPFIVAQQKIADKGLHSENALMAKSPGVIAHCYANKVVSSTENIKFGSLGSPKLTIVQQGIIQNGAVEDQGRLASERDFKHGEPVKSGETIASRVPSVDSQQSSFQCSYQLKDEDFPPLPFCSQPRRSTGFDVQKDLANRRPHYQACVVSTSS